VSNEIVVEASTSKDSFIYQAQGMKKDMVLNYQVEFMDRCSSLAFYLVSSFFLNGLLYIKK